MTYLASNLKQVPTGLRKFLHINWPLVVLISAICSMGFLMLYSVAGGSMQPWAEPQMMRFGLGIVIMFLVGFVPIWLWRNLSGAVYMAAFLMLVYVELFGHTGMGATRWINLGFMMVQPSEIMKIAMIMLLAAYYDWLDVRKVSRPLWVLIPLLIIVLPTVLVLKQPDLGTSTMLIAGGGLLMFAAGVSWIYFAVVIALVVGAVALVLNSRGTPWQLLHDYQFRRIDTFLDPGNDPLGAGYHITQAKIALGSGGWAGRGFMEGTQSRLNFLPEKHTDFIFTSLAEELGFVGGMSLLTLYALLLFFTMSSGVTNKDRYGSLLTIGIAGTLFIYITVNMSMVMGLAPAKGAPLPFVSYGGTVMLVLLWAYGLVQSAHIHKPR
ncbi:rod shape-determining protein RodA [Haematobacter massiliensis]|uniref:Peptidoglycan glycosyltransferase MrdB n=1 Tax=Haematobacter massiliensis TaxID=195105 RepID=A0A086XXM1_9RHOB|nr:rod shape-determining protein RodA [Haematobacter massiliensis]KFI26771.1 cell wall shape-determining protein [Haematobacter massiliensis]OWJ69510.1 rod shape-determining protein RodA [Haematobacter massiliensis]OWJ87626.1 rod shape-determining protein RodA [Haematobacter massiliensis]QBJ23692.1 rod shape-determining protein RodA [Haematobacter massiliensis]